MRPKASARTLSARRRRALALLDEGLPLRAVARRIGCDPSSVLRWRNRRAAAGERVYEVRRPPGRPPQEIAELRRLLAVALEAAKRPDARGARARQWLEELFEERRKADPWHVPSPAEDLEAYRKRLEGGDVLALFRAFSLVYDRSSPGAVIVPEWIARELAERFDRLVFWEPPGRNAIAKALGFKQALARARQKFGGPHDATDGIATRVVYRMRDKRLGWHAACGGGRAELLRVDGEKTVDYSTARRALLGRSLGVDRLMAKLYRDLTGKAPPPPGRELLEAYSRACRPRRLAESSKKLA